MTSKTKKAAYLHQHNEDDRNGNDPSTPEQQRQRERHAHDACHSEAMSMMTMLPNQCLHDDTNDNYGHIQTSMMKTTMTLPVPAWQLAPVQWH